MDFPNGSVHTGVGHEDGGVKRTRVNPAVSDAPRRDVRRTGVTCDVVVNGRLRQYLVVLDRNEAGEQKQHKRHREGVVPAAFSHVGWTDDGGHQAFSSSPTGC